MLIRTFGRTGPVPVRVAGRLLLAALLFTGAACRPDGPPAARPARHVVVLVVDTLRANHLPTYGYGRDTAPFIERLGKEGVVFENAVSTSSYTAEAISSLFSGFYPSATSWGAGWHARPSLNHETLATTFQKAGYRTALFSETPMLNHPEYLRGFEHRVCLTEFGVSGQARNLVDQALAWMERHADEPTLLYLHILDPHAPYAPPAAEEGAFVTTRPAHPVEMESDLRVRLTELKQEGFGPGEERFENMVQRYDAEIAYVDGAIEALFHGLARLGTLEDTLAVFTADHGEEFLDHGYVEHAWKLYPETFRVPMILWKPGLIAPERRTDVASLVDLMPTLLHLQGLAEPHEMNGAPLFLLENNTVRPVSQPEPRTLELLIQSRCLIRGFITEDELYLAYWKWLSPEACEAVARQPKENRMAFYEGVEQPTDPWGPIIREEYYDLKADPGCKEDRAAQHPEALARWRARLEEYRATCPIQLPDRYKATKEPDALEPIHLPILENIDPAFLAPPPEGLPDAEMLRALGYL